MLPAPGMRRPGPARAVRHVEEVGEASREGLDDGCGANQRGANVARGCQSSGEAVGVDDGDAGDGLVLDEDEGGGRAAAEATWVAAAATKEERRRRLDGGGGGRLGARRRCSK